MPPFMTPYAATTWRLTVTNDFMTRLWTTVILKPPGVFIAHMRPGDMSWFIHASLER